MDEEIVTSYRANIILTFLGILFFTFAVAQTEQEAEEQDLVSQVAPKVYMDCDFCDLDYLRQQITFINYVRERTEADIHILVTRELTGGGGKENAVLFIGQNEYEGMNDTIIYLTAPDDTEEEIGKAGAKALKIGLMYYVGKTPLGQYIKITYEREAVPVVLDDKWNKWVFELNMGTWFYTEESFSRLSLWSSVNISQVTNNWKTEIRASANYNENQFDIGTETITSLQRSQDVRATLVKSLGGHWSVGIFGKARSSLFRNIAFQYSFRPAIEVDLFPYSISSRKELRIGYYVGGIQSYYNDTTIYDKLEESRFHQRMAVNLEIKQKWGSVRSTIEASNYLHDFSFYRVRFWNRTNVRLFKGLSLRVSGWVEIIHDQLSLEKQGATAEEILLRQKQLNTAYEVGGNVGITYTFGSIYNNVVNPRFGF